METEEKRLQSERLPTLYEVLNNQTAAPVDSWSFYTFLFQYPGALNYMDFWVDVMAHLRFCKDYVRGIRESMLLLELEEQEQNQMAGAGAGAGSGLIDMGGHLLEGSGATSDEQQHGKPALSTKLKAATKRFSTESNENSNINPTSNRLSVSSSLLLDALLNDGYLDYHDNKRINQFLKTEAESERLSQLLETFTRSSTSGGNGNGYPGGLAATSTIHNNTNDYHDDTHLSMLLDEFLSRQMKDTERPKLTTKQLIASANAIVDRYLITKEGMQSDRLLTSMPEHMRLEVINMVKGEQRYDPDVFEPLKIISFQFLEIYCFPKFLSSVALHNLHYDILLNRKVSTSPYSQCTTLSRVATGFLFWGIGFWLGYSLILLNYSRPVRIVTAIPFLIGCYYIVCGIYHLDIIYAVCGVTQTLVSPRKFEEPELGLHKKSNTNSSNKIPFFFSFLGGRNRLTKVRHPFVLSIMRKRALWCMVLVLFTTAILTAIFAGVPSTRL